MAKTKYFIQLSEYEKNLLYSIINDKTEPDRVVLRAQILLQSDISLEPRLSVLKLAEQLGTTHTTIQTTRTEYAEGGLEKALYRKKHIFTNNKYNAEVIENIQKLMLEQPPKGHKKWSIRLLCDAAEKRGIVENIGPSSLFRILNNEDILEK